MKKNVFILLLVCFSLNVVYGYNKVTETAIAMNPDCLYEVRGNEIIEINSKNFAEKVAGYIDENKIINGEQYIVGEDGFVYGISAIDMELILMHSIIATDKKAFDEKETTDESSNSRGIRSVKKRQSVKKTTSSTRSRGVRSAVSQSKEDFKKELEDLRVKMLPIDKDIARINQQIQTILRNPRQAGAVENIKNQQLLPLEEKRRVLEKQESEIYDKLSIEELNNEVKNISEQITKNNDEYNKQRVKSSPDAQFFLFQNTMLNKKISDLKKRADNIKMQEIYQEYDMSNYEKAQITLDSLNTEIKKLNDKIKDEHAQYLETIENEKVKFEDIKSGLGYEISEYNSIINLLTPKFNELKKAYLEEQKKLEEARVQAEKMEAIENIENSDDSAVMDFIQKYVMHYKKNDMKNIIKMMRNEYEKFNKMNFNQNALTGQQRAQILNYEGQQQSRFNSFLFNINLIPAKDNDIKIALLKWSSNLSGLIKTGLIVSSPTSANPSVKK